MGDNAENALPPSKKRAAGRELSRDNPGLDDEEEVPGEETGTFKRAPEEVLANRRIVKVRRSQQSQSQPSSTPSSNPFAAIRLVPPTPTPTPPPVTVQETEKTEVESVSPSSVNKKTEKEGENDKSTPENIVDDKTEVVEKKADEEKKEEENVTEKGDDDNKENDENAPEAEKGDNNNEEKEESTPEAEKKENSSVSSFQQLSSSQNAFTGLVGTGFSTSSFSFGSINPKTDDNNNNNSTATPFPSFSFATNGSLNSTTSLFPENRTEKIPTMQEVHVETGEENENAVFTADSALFEFLDGGWKERGKGELKVNVLTTGTKKARLVMRARGNYRLILNASIYPDMKLTNMEKKGITFACFNSTGEGKEGLSTFALKFKDASIVEEFRTVVTEYKGNANANANATDGSTTATTSLKTPENSPKASDE